MSIRLSNHNKGETTPLSPQTARSWWIIIQNSRWCCRSCHFIRYRVYCSVECIVHQTVVKCDCIGIRSCLVILYFELAHPATWQSYSATLTHKPLEEDGDSFSQLLYHVQYCLLYLSTECVYWACSRELKPVMCSEPGKVRPHTVHHSRTHMGQRRQFVSYLVICSQSVG